MYVEEAPVTRRLLPGQLKPPRRNHIPTPRRHCHAIKVSVTPERGASLRIRAAATASRRVRSLVRVRARLYDRAPPRTHGRNIKIEGARRGTYPPPALRTRARATRAVLQVDCILRIRDDVFTAGGTE